MSTAPCCWNQVIDPQHCVDLEDFLNGVKYNEEALVNPDTGAEPDLESRIKKLEKELLNSGFKFEDNMAS